MDIQQRIEGLENSVSYLLSEFSGEKLGLLGLRCKLYNV
jgi:hypothetical protein